MPAGTRRLSLQIAAVLVAMLAVVGLLTVWLFESDEHAAADRDLRAAARSMVPGDRAPGFWVVVERGRTTVTDSFPRGLPVQADLDSVGADHLPRQHEVRVDQHTYVVRTQVRGQAVAQVAMDRTGAQATSRRAITAVALAGGVGVVMAAAIAVWLAKRVTAQSSEKAERTSSSVRP